MKKAIKIVLIVFVSLNAAGGALLGIYKYLADRQAEEAFNSFYQGGQVKGAFYDPGSQSFTQYFFFFFGGFVFAMALIILAYHYLRKHQSITDQTAELKPLKNESIQNQTQKTENTPEQLTEKKRVIRLG